VLDASKCISAITIEDHGPIAPAQREELGDWIFGCDVCQEVCPWNRHAPGSAEPAFQPRGDQASLPLAEVLALDERGFRARFRGSPLLRAKRRGLLRSAAIVLGNRPHPPSFAALAAAVADDDAVIRAAAAWALGRWIAANAMPAEARDVLASRRPIEPDATVQAEIEAGLGQHKPGVHDPSD
jgi:epoxyqueuosine reductase